MHARSLMHKKSLASLHSQPNSYLLGSDDAYTHTNCKEDVDIQMLSKYKKAGMDDFGTIASKKSWISRFCTRRSKSMASCNYGFDQAEAFADPLLESANFQSLASHFEEPDDLPRLERALTTTSLRSFFKLKEPNSLKRQKSSLDIDCFKLETDFINFDDNDQNNQNKNHVAPRKKHCGRRLKQFFSRGRHKTVYHKSFVSNEKQQQASTFIPSKSTSSTDTYVDKKASDVGPKFEAMFPLKFTPEPKSQRNHGKKHDYLYQSIRFSKPHTRAHSCLQNCQYHEEPTLENIFSATQCTQTSFSSPSLRDTSVVNTQHKLYNKCCKQLPLNHGSRVDIEPSTDKKFNNGSTLDDNSQSELSSTTTNPTEVWQVYPGEANKPIISTKLLQPIVPVVENFLKAGKSVKSNYRHCYNYQGTLHTTGDLKANFCFDTSSPGAEESRKVSQYFPSPVPSVPSSPKLNISISKENEEKLHSPPLTYTTQRLFNSAPEFVLPPSAAATTFTNTLGRTNMGIEIGTVRSSKYHGSLRASASTEAIVKEPWKQLVNYDADTENEKIYRNLRPPMKVNGQWI